jgi:predicted phage baseplate assembly protein
VINPLAASGGAEPETLSKARQNAPNTVRTLGRIVSLRDFEDAARAYAGIAKARATWQWDGFEQAVSLTVAGDYGATIESGSATHQDLLSDLNSRRDPHRKLTINSYRPVPVQATATIKVAADQNSTTVQANALSALESYLDFDNLELGQSIHLSDVMAALQAVKGVEAVDVDKLQYKDAGARSSHGASTDPVQAHLLLLPNELATVSDTASDLVINIGLS